MDRYDWQNLISSQPRDRFLRQQYSDWLEERGFDAAAREQRRVAYLLGKNTEQVFDEMSDAYVEVARLRPADRMDAINDFVWYRLGYGVDNEAFDDFVVGCEIVYKDDYETGESWYQVLDAQGHGDGSGQWYPV